MNKVVDLKEFREQERGLPTIVLIDLHEELRHPQEAIHRRVYSEALENCRTILNHARACGFPIGFTRQCQPAKTLYESPSYPRWLDGFEPTRSDMVFDRERLSCYGSADFSAMARDIGGSYVIAGQIGELSCLSTVIDAFHRDHRVTVISDALISHAREPLSESAMAAAVSRIISLYAEPVKTQSWINFGARNARIRT